MNITALSSNWLIGHKEPSTGRPPFLGTRGARRLIIVGVVLLFLAVLAGVLPRLSQHRQATADTKQLAVPNVSVVSPSVGAPADGLMLPAEVKPWQEASIFSRVNGYLKSWVVDIGAHVDPEQLLAEIDTPDLDHQLEQARSQAAMAQKSLEPAKSTNEKWQQLFHQGVVSQLDAEN